MYKSVTSAPSGQPPANTLATLADEINDHHHKAEAAMRSSLEHALEAGQLLEEAKGQCAHGAWGTWLEENFEGSQRTAQAYMRVAKRWPEIEAKAQRVADLGFRDAVKLLAAPKKTRITEADNSQDDAPPEGDIQGKGVLLANEAINCLIRIPKNDSLRKRGFQIVTDWIKHNK